MICLTDTRFHLFKSFLDIKESSSVFAQSGLYKEQDTEGTWAIGSANANWK